jgi:hypothetical protein
MFGEHEVLKMQFRNDNSMQVLSERVKLLLENHTLRGSFGFSDNQYQSTLSRFFSKIREWHHEYVEKDLSGSWKR